MIIKRKNSKQPEILRDDVSEVQPVAEDFVFEPLPQAVPLSDEQISVMEDFEPVFEETESSEEIQTEENLLLERMKNVKLQQTQKIQEPLTPQKPQEAEEIDLFNLDNIDFKQRQERRRGDRRRGFRRVDDRNLISRAREEADSIREAAGKEGYQEGLRQAEEDIFQIKEALKEFLGAPQEVFEYIAPEILEISVDIAQKIIKKELTQNPEIVLEKITEILKTLPKEEPKVTIRVNPMQVSLAKQAIPEMLEAAGLETKIVILQDETLTEGGCVVTTNNGVIDATIESQIAIVKEALKEV